MDSASAARAGTTVTGIFLVGLAIAGAVALVTAPITPRLAKAETAANPNDQPTARTLPPGTSTVKSAGRPADRATGRVRPPSAIDHSTDVMDTGSTRPNRVDPLEHLPSNYRRDRRN